MPADKFSALQSKLHLTPEEMVDRELFAIHPRFRILALAAPPARNSPWLTNEVGTRLHSDPSAESGTVPSTHPDYRTRR